MAIKVGDKVKATLGESVVVGEVNHVADNYVGIDIDPISEGGKGSAEVMAWSIDGWNIEVIQDLPTRAGALIRNNRDGALYVRLSSDRGAAYEWADMGDIGVTWGDDTVAEGGFEILFGGVDE